MNHRASLLSAGCALALGTSCGSGEAFDIALVPDENLSTEAELATLVGTLVYVFDSPEGLYAPGEEQTFEAVQIKDADADPSDLEMVVTVPVEDGRLPLVRVERGGLPDVVVDVRVLGLPVSGEGPPIASGELRGLRFGADTEQVSVPFDLRDDVLPARVASVVPEDGSDLPGCAVSSLEGVFSRPVDPASLLVPGAVQIEPGAGPVDIYVDDSGLVATLVPQGISSKGDSLSIHLKVGESVVDRDGQPFDQVPRQEGAQPFDAVIAYVCVPPPSAPDTPCGGIYCARSGRIACIDDRCTLAHCSAECGERTVCDPLRDRCVDDCRNADAVSACLEGTGCDAATGLCIPP